MVNIGKGLEVNKALNPVLLCKTLYQSLLVLKNPSLQVVRHPCV